MTDQPDDTLLDDDVEEHDFNFDNEKEEALLADNEFDSFVEEHSEKESLDPNGPLEIEHLEQEEDVLDIGITEEDIVENELISVPNALNASVDFEPEDETVHNDNSIPVVKTDDEKGSESEQIPKMADIEKEDEIINEHTSRTCAEDTLLEDDKHVSSEKNDETFVKPTIISLKKHDSKSYDDLPDLTKVIELVQPHGSPRHRKHGRPLQSFVIKSRPFDTMKATKREDFNERNDSKYDYNYQRKGKDDSRSNDDSKRSYSNENRCDTSLEIINQSERVTEVRSSHNFVSEYKNFSSQSLVPRSDIHVERPIVATVQITQERYQIAGDFHIIRPSMGNSCQPLIRPFERNRVFQSRGTSSPHTSHQIPRLPGFHNVQSLIPSSNSDNYNRVPLLHPGAPRPMPRRPLLPPSSPGLLSQPMSQRFPPHGGPPRHNFAPPFIGPNGSLTAPPPPPHNYQQPRSQFGLNSAPTFPQTFSRPPPFSQPPPPLSSVNGPYYLGNMSHVPNPAPSAPNSVYQNRPPPLGHFQRMPNDGSHSVVFQQSSQRIIRMPPVHASVNDNPQCIMSSDGGVAHSSPGDYYVKESITTTYLPPPVTSQPSPPGVVPSYQTNPTVSYSGGDAGSLESNQIGCNRFSREDYYTDQRSDKYSHHSASGYSFRNVPMSIDQDRNPHYLKRSSSTSMNDDNSAKRYRYYSNDKSSDGNDVDEIEYCKKVEHQKKMREKFVQMKEEQRLKNQMQNFIQNNIKGVLQRREQLLRKNEPESNTSNRFVNVKTKDSNYRSEEPTRNRNHHSVCNVGDKISEKISPPRKQIDNKYPLNNTRNSSHSDDSRAPPVVTQHLQNNDSVKTKEVAERLKIDEKNDAKNITKQLHKIVKIKYKDGTIALKSFPVTGPAKKNLPSIDTSNAIDSLNVTVHEDDNNMNSNRRRMVVSKYASSSGENNDASSHNENIIVESVRKGVTQSSVPLAQRFSNLKPSMKNENDEDSSISVGMKSTNRLVISHEEKMRTVWIKNINPNTKTGLIQKLAGSCGKITRMRWIPGAGSSNEAKITFSKADEAKKFIHNYHRKTVDTSMILVTSMVSDNK